MLNMSASGLEASSSSQKGEKDPCFPKGGGLEASLGHVMPLRLWEGLEASLGHVMTLTIRKKEGGL